MPKFTLKKSLLCLWLLVPLATLVLATRSAYHRALNTEEYAYACDQFGYLRMAKEIRSAVSEHRSAQFKLESDRTRQLIEFMKSKQVPLPKWEEVVAPHAHHYFPVSDSVGVQYPPGTALTLAVFPEGQAVYDLNRVVVVVLAVAGVAALIVAFLKDAWLSAALAILGIQTGLSILARVGSVSFSINASLVPLLLVVLLTLLAYGLRSANRNRMAWAAALALGCVLGYAILVRVTTILFVPGLIVLLWPRSRPFRFANLVIPLMLGLVVIGIVPVLWHQQHISGAWYLPTYGRIDATAPTISRLEHHLSYYFGDEFAAKDNWALLYAAVGFAGFGFLLRGSKPQTSFDLSWRRVALSAVTLWVVPTIFFLSHSVHGLHYAMPTTFAVVALVGFASLAIEANRNGLLPAMQPVKIQSVLGLVLIAVASLGALRHAWLEREAPPLPAQPLAHAEAPLPDELVNPHAWIWADLLTGTLWYYHQKAAFKIGFSDPETRALMFKFVHDRGEPQYLLRDSDTMEIFMGEITKLGGTLEQRGTVDGQPYFLIHWPNNGPATTTPIAYSTTGESATCRC